MLKTANNKNSYVRGKKQLVTSFFFFFFLQITGENIWLVRTGVKDLKSSKPCNSGYEMCLMAQNWNALMMQALVFLFRCHLETIKDHNCDCHTESYSSVC